ncbi:MAG TPA: NUDIX domain-containing protein [Steroidobacteraceae bacterium]|nr:NUDIX domain-containing protein [Steroidobacteraceae bacterium]
MTDTATPRGTAEAPRPAATVLLLREDEGRLEVLMTRRAAQLAFLGSLWVFPGGRLEPADCSPEIAERVLPEARTACTRLRQMSGDPLDASTSLGLHVAGCRETFEESGVLLARSRDGSACDAGQMARLKAHRASIAASGASFLDALIAEDLYLDVAPLVHWAHWITPAWEKRRYDTHFFVIEVPAAQEAEVDRTETTEHAWVTAGDALQRAQAGEMMMAPPTLATLTDLAESYRRHGRLSAMLSAERNRRVPPILPKVLMESGQVLVVLPWDPDYARLPGESCRVLDGGYPEHLAHQPSRRTMPMPARGGTGGG